METRTLILIFGMLTSELKLSDLILYLILRSIKYVTLEGGRGSEKVRQFVTREGVKSMWRHAYKKIYHTHETWNLKWFLTFCCNRYILTEGGTGKIHRRTKPSRQTLGQKPRTKALANNWENLYRGLLSGFFVLGLLKMGGGPRCVTYFWGSRDVWRSVTWGGGSKLAKNSVTYFMDGPLYRVTAIDSSLFSE